MTQFSNQISVAIIGGGPAGVAAAAALAASNVRVTIFESGSTLGGKVSSWQTDGRSCEHGMHGWWPSYLNFDRLLHLAGINPPDVLVPSLLQAIVNTSTYNDVTLVQPTNALPAPFHLLNWAIRGGVSSSTIDAARNFFNVVLAFDYEKDFDRYDQLSLQDIIDSTAAPVSLQVNFIQPFVRSFAFTEPDVLSAAAGLAAMNFYLVADGDVAHPRWCVGGPSSVIFEPIKRWLASRDCHVHFGSRVASITESEGRVTLNFGSDEVAAKIPLASIPADSFLEIRAKDANIAVGYGNGKLSCFDTRCTHMGCQVKVSTEGFLCPCHGGKFNKSGEVLQGPPSSPLKRIPIHVDGDFAVIGTDAYSMGAFDAVILATDVESAKKITAASEILRESAYPKLEKLRTTPVIVVRMWFDLPVSPNLPQSGVFIRPQFADNFFVLNSVSNHYDKEGLVIELQCYRCEHWIGIPDSEIILAACQDLKSIQNLAAPPRSFLVQRHNSLFTLLNKGSKVHRLSSSVGMGKVFFAGDWTWVDQNVWMMERAVVSGLNAASAICVAMGKKSQFGATFKNFEVFSLIVARRIARLRAKF